MVVGDYELHPGEATGHQGAPEGEPSGAVFSGGQVDAEDLTVPFGVDAGGDQQRNVDDAAAFTDFDRHRVRPHIRIRARIERPAAEIGDHIVERGGHLRNLGLRQ